MAAASYFNLCTDRVGRAAGFADHQRKDGYSIDPVRSV